MSLGMIGQTAPYITQGLKGMKLNSYLDVFYISFGNILLSLLLFLFTSV